MKDQECLKYCLNEIERKLNWEKSSSWKEPEFVHLSEIISQESEISISAHTLKRLYGKIKYNKYYNPQRATKNALAIFLGFSDWKAFVTHYQNTIGSEEKSRQDLIGQYKSYGVLVWVLSAVVFLFIVVQWIIPLFSYKSIEKTDPFLFDLNDSVGTVPYTVSVKYNIEQLPSDSIFIDFDFTHPVLGPQIVNLDKERSLYNYTYQIPGYYYVRLKRSGRNLATHNVLAMSEEWNSYMYYEEKREFWLDNKLQPFQRSGYLYYSPEDLRANGFNTKPVYYMAHRFFKEFEIDGDHFEMRVRFKNSKESGGITCYDFITKLFCENNLSYFNLMEKGCSGFSGIKVGETKVSGVQEDLSSFTFFAERWNILRVLVKDRQVRVFMNDELIHEGGYSGSNGKIVGIEHVFKGAGMLDYIRLKDLGAEREFVDNFE